MSSSNVRPWNRAEDMPILSKWWEAYNWPVPHDDILPDTGFVASTPEGEMAAAGFIVITNTALCLFEYTIGNPYIGDEQRRSALDSLAEYVIQWSRDAGAGALCTLTDNKRWISRLKKNAFQEGDQNLTSLVRRV